MRVGTEMGSELDWGVVVCMGEHTEFCIDGVCSEFGFGRIPEMVGESCVSLHPSPLQGSDVLALLMIMKGDSFKVCKSYALRGSGVSPMKIRNVFRCMNILR